MSADLVPTGGSFIEYLNMIKQADRVAGISTSATIQLPKGLSTCCRPKV